MKGLVCWYIAERKGDALELAKKVRSGEHWELCN